MLQKTLAAHRVYDLHEISGFRDKNEEYNYFKNIAFAVFEMILKKYIPEEKEMEFDGIFFEYDLAIESMMLVFAQEAYKQGLVDGIELSNILTVKH